MSKFITAEARLSFPHFFQPAEPYEAGGKLYYQADLIFEPGAGLDQLRAEVEKTFQAYDWGPKPPKEWRSPIKSCVKNAERGLTGYEEGSFYITPKNEEKPGIVVGPNREPLVERSEIYGGCYVRAQVVAYCYNTKGNKGVGLSLRNIWKTRDGEPFGEKRDSAEEAFEAVDAEAYGASDLI